MAAEEKSKLPTNGEQELSASAPDFILFRLEVDEEAASPTVMSDLQEDLQELTTSSLPGNLEMPDRNILKATLGQRKMQEIRLERYCSQGRAVFLCYDESSENMVLSWISEFRITIQIAQILFSMAVIALPWLIMTCTADGSRTSVLVLKVLYSLACFEVLDGALFKHFKETLDLFKCACSCTCASIEQKYLTNCTCYDKIVCSAQSKESTDINCVVLSSFMIRMCS